METPKPQTKIDEKILAKALAQNYSKVDAYKKAGGQSDNEGTAIRTVNDYLQKNPDLKIDIIKQMEQKRDDVLDSMSAEKARGMPYTKGAVALGILTDKIQLLKGDPTERLEVMPRMIFKGGMPQVGRIDRPEIAEETNKSFKEGKKDAKKEDTSHPIND